MRTTLGEVRLPRRHGSEAAARRPLPAVVIDGGPALLSGLAEFPGGWDVALERLAGDAQLLAHRADVGVLLPHRGHRQPGLGRGPLVRAAAPGSGPHQIRA